MSHHAQMCSSVLNHFQICTCDNTFIHLANVYGILSLMWGDTYAYLTNRTCIVVAGLEMDYPQRSMYQSCGPLDHVVLKW